jgi:hypothetical protein
MRYKRNQLEEAIWATLDNTSNSSNTEFLVRVKRLLETDRDFDDLSRTTSAARRGRFAFFTGESPGSGREIWFSHYEVFAVLTALRVQDHGFPKARVVEILRTVRSRLEAEHTRILKQTAAAPLRPLARTGRAAGDLAVQSADPVFLVIATGGHTRKDRAESPRACAVCRGDADVAHFRRDVGADSWTMFELTISAHLLAQNLKKTQPRGRGRAPR